MNQSIVTSIASAQPLTGTPWETVGHAIPKNASAEETLKVAKLDWTVVKAESKLFFSEDPASAGTPGTITRIIPNPKSFGIVRTDNHEILSPHVGTSYKPIQNSDAFRIFHDFIRAGQMTMETAGELLGGRHVWGLTKIGKRFELCDGEVIEGYFLLLQSHAYGHSLRAMFTPIRFPGGHTLMQNISLHGVRAGSTYTMPHSSDFTDDRIKDIHKLLKLSHEAMNSFEKTAKLMASSKMSERRAVLYILKTFDPDFLLQKQQYGEKLAENFDELLNDPIGVNRAVKTAIEVVENYPGCDLLSCKGTAWGYYNAIAHTFDHVVGRSPHTRLKSAWIGANAKKKIAALDLGKLMAVANL